jgi:hypothetical protein
MAINTLYTEFESERVVHEPSYNLSSMGTTSTSRVINTWKSLGKSKNRTSIQAEQAQNITAQQLKDTNLNTIIAFTDGSALGNPVPCGAFAVLYANGIDSQPIHIRKAISRKRSS